MWAGSQQPAGCMTPVRRTIKSKTSLEMEKYHSRYHIQDRANAVVHHLGLVTAFTGARLQQLMANHLQNTEDLL